MAYQTTGYYPTTSYQPLSYQPMATGAAPMAPMAPRAPMAPTPPAAPRAPMAPAAPMAPTTYSPYQQSTTYSPYQQQTQYRAQATTAPVQVSAQTASAIQAITANAPMIAGALPGHTSTESVREAKAFFTKARMSAATTRGMQQKQVALDAGTSSMWGSITGAIKTSLIFNGLLSLAINGYMLYTNQETNQDAGANVAGDLTTAVVGGAAAGAATMGGTYLLAGILGVGLPLTLCGMALGCVGYFLAANVWQSTSIYNQIKAAVHNAA